GELERCYLDVLAEAGQEPDAAYLGRLGRKAAGRLVGNIQPCALSQTKLVGVLGDAMKAQHLPKLREEHIVRVGQRVSDVHALLTVDAQLGFRRDDAFLESGQGHHRLKGGAWRESAGERQLLIHNGEDPSRVWVDDHDASVPPA